MKKTVYINESSINRRVLNEIRIPSKINQDFSLAIRENNFPFKRLLGLSSDESSDLISHFLEDSYKIVRNNIIELENINVDEDSDLRNALSQLMAKVKDKEKARKSELETMCLNKVVKLFSVPEETIDFSIKLVDNVSSGNSLLQLKPEDTPIDYSDFNEMNEIKHELSKRYITNIMIAGACNYYTKFILEDLFNNDLLDDETFEMYMGILVLNNYLLLSDPGIELRENDKKETGFVEVKLGDDEYKTFIRVEAVNLPILIYETVKGIMELFSAHGLPEEKYISYYIMKKADCVENELWYMRTGISLWNSFIHLKDDLPNKKMPYLFTGILSLPNGRFNHVMKEISFNTKKAKKIVNKMSDDIEYEDFVKNMSVGRLDKNIIEDEFIHPEEL